MFMIFYALIGIPVNGFLFAYLGDFFGKAVRHTLTQYCNGTTTISQSISVAVSGRPRTIQSVQNGNDEELCTTTSRPHCANYSLLDSRHCDIFIFAITDIFIFRELDVHRVVVLFICDIDDHGIW